MGLLRGQIAEHFRCCLARAFHTRALVIWRHRSRQRSFLIGEPAACRLRCSLSQCFPPACIRIPLENAFDICPERSQSASDQSMPMSSCDRVCPPQRKGARLRSAIGTLALDEKPSYTIGRVPNFADHVIEHASTSRRHATLFHGSDGRLYIMDLNSANGTFLEGDPLPAHKPIALWTGAILKFGESPTEWSLTGVPGTEPPKPEPAPKRQKAEPGSNGEQPFVSSARTGPERQAAPSIQIEGNMSAEEKKRAIWSAKAVEPEDSLSANKWETVQFQDQERTERVSSSYHTGHSIH